MLTHGRALLDGMYIDDWIRTSVLSSLPCMDRHHQHSRHASFPEVSTVLGLGAYTWTDDPAKK